MGPSRGVCIDSGAEGTAVKRVVHIQGSNWLITSNVKLDEELLEADLTSTLLPGRLGQYFLPKDAVFSMTNEAVTTTQMFQSVVKDETERTHFQLSGTCTTTAKSTVNHVSIETPLVEEECFVEEEGEEEDEIEDPDGEDVETEDIADEDDDDDKEWPSVSITSS